MRFFSNPPSVSPSLYCSLPLSATTTCFSPSRSTGTIWASWSPQQKVAPFVPISSDPSLATTLSMSHNQLPNDKSPFCMPIPAVATPPLPLLPPSISALFGPSDADISYSPSWDQAPPGTAYAASSTKVKFDSRCDRSSCVYLKPMTSTAISTTDQSSVRTM